jgi:hypothetical protein
MGGPLPINVVVGKCWPPMDLFCIFSFFKKAHRTLSTCRTSSLGDKEKDEYLYNPTSEFLLLLRSLSPLLHINNQFGYGTQGPWPWFEMAY